MARRVNFGAGAGAGLQSVGQSLVRYGLLEQSRQLQDEQINLRDLETRVEKGELPPERAEAEASLRKLKVPKGYFHTLQPTMGERLGGVIGEMTKAPSLEQVPSEAALRENTTVQRVRPQMGPAGPTFPSGTGHAPAESSTPGELASTSLQPTNPALNILQNIRREKIGSFPPVKVEGQMGPTGEKFTSYEPQATMSGRKFTTELPSEQMGTLEGKKKLSTFQAGEGSPEYVARKIGIENETEAGTRGGKIQTAVSQQAALLPGEVKKAGATAAASESARLNTYFRPEFVKARLNQVSQEAIAQAKATGDAKAMVEARDAVNAASTLMPFLQKMTNISAQLNTGEGIPARVKGMVAKGAAWAGMENLVSQQNSLIAQNIRPLALALGMREANLSAEEQVMAREATFIDPGLTRTERFQKLLDIRDAIIVGPSIRSRLPLDATFEQRWNYALDAARQTRAVEDKAREQGVKRFKDPVTGAILDVVYK